MKNLKELIKPETKHLIDMAATIYPTIFKGLWEVLENTNHPYQLRISDVYDLNLATGCGYNPVEVCKLFNKEL